MKAFKLITHAQAFEILADPTRRRIIYLLRARELTVSQIAEELDLTPQAIYHHIRKLRDADMVEVAKEERVDHFIETYYRATAEVFNLSHGETASRSDLEAHTREALDALEKLGFRVPKDRASIQKIVDLEQKMEKVGEQEAFQERIAELEGVDFFTKQSLAHYAKILTMSDEEFEEYTRLVGEHRKLLKAQVLEPSAT